MQQTVCSKGKRLAPGAIIGTLRCSSKCATVSYEGKQRKRVTISSNLESLEESHTWEIHLGRPQHLTLSINHVPLVRPVCQVDTVQTEWRIIQVMICNLQDQCQRETAHVSSSNKNSAPLHYNTKTVFPIMSINHLFLKYVLHEFNYIKYMNKLDKTVCWITVYLHGHTEPANNDLKNNLFCFVFL